MKLKAMTNEELRRMASNRAGIPSQRTVASAMLAERAKGKVEVCKHCRQPFTKVIQMDRFCGIVCAEAFYANVESAAPPSGIKL